MQIESHTQYVFVMNKIAQLTQVIITLWKLSRGGWPCGTQHLQHVHTFLYLVVMYINMPINDLLLQYLWHSG